MFNNHEALVRKSGKKGIDRPDFIRELIEEYKKSDDKGTVKNCLKFIILYKNKKYFLHFMYQN